jgi:hypothetical protein
MYWHDVSPGAIVRGTMGYTVGKWDPGEKIKNKKPGLANQVGWRQQKIISE